VPVDVRVPITDEPLEVLEAGEYLFLDQNQIEVTSGLQKIYIRMRAYVGHYHPAIKFRPHQVLYLLVCLLQLTVELFLALLQHLYRKLPSLLKSLLQGVVKMVDETNIERLEVLILN